MFMVIVGSFYKKNEQAFRMGYVPLPHIVLFLANDLAFGTLAQDTSQFSVH